MTRFPFVLQRITRWRRSRVKTYTRKTYGVRLYIAIFSACKLDNGMDFSVTGIILYNWTKMVWYTYISNWFRSGRKVHSRANNDFGWRCKYTHLQSLLISYFFHVSTNRIILFPWSYTCRNTILNEINYEIQKKKKPSTD